MAARKHQIWCQDSSKNKFRSLKNIKYGIKIALKYSSQKGKKYGSQKA
jgi:hypothetical protein